MLFTVVNVQFITGSQLGIHEVIGTWNTLGKHWHVQGAVGRGGLLVGWGGFDTAGAHVGDRVGSRILTSADATAQVCLFLNSLFTFKKSS